MDMMIRPAFGAGWTWKTTSTLRVLQALRKAKDKAKTFQCHLKFRSGSNQVDEQRAPIKRSNVGQMRETLLVYLAEGAEWPLPACIFDPRRVSIVCSGPAEMLEVLQWMEGCEAATGLQVSGTSSSAE